jgi:hypothetical protein
MHSPGFLGICSLGVSLPVAYPGVGANFRLKRGSIDGASRKCWANLDTASMRCREVRRIFAPSRRSLMPASRDAQFASNEIL